MFLPFIKAFYITILFTIILRVSFFIVKFVFVISLFIYRYINIAIFSKEKSFYLSILHK